MTLRLVLALLLSLSPALFGQTLPQFFVVDTIAGTFSLGDGGPATAARLWSPDGIVVDPAGNLFIADGSNHMVRKVAPDGTITSVAGQGACGFGAENAQADKTFLCGPNSVALDTNGNLYIVENIRVRRVSRAGVITTVAGVGGTPGFVGDGGPATTAQLRFPRGIAVDKDGNLFIADASNHRIRKVTPAGIISTYAGTGTGGMSGDGGPATAAQLNNPNSLAFDAQGNLFVNDSSNLRVRKITPSGTITTEVGNGNFGSGGDGGPATLATLAFVQGIAFDAAGNLFLADFNNHKIRRVAANGVISTVAGTGNLGLSGDGGDARSADLNLPVSVASDASGNVYLTDANHRVRKVTQAGAISTYAGRVNAGGDGGPAANASFLNPRGVASDGAGGYYVSDSGNHLIRRVTADGQVTTVVGVAGVPGSTGDQGPGTAAKLNTPQAIFADSTGLFIADNSNQKIRRLVGSVLQLFAGSGTFGYDGDNRLATAAQFRFPADVASDGKGNVYIADNQNHRIRVVGSDGAIKTLAGTGTAGSAGDGGQAAQAQLNFPQSVAVDSAGNVYIADQSNNRIRKVTPGGIISTVVNTAGTAGSTGDGGPALQARVSLPIRVNVDAANNLYVMESNRIRRVGGDGVITTIAGNGSTIFSGDGGLATQAGMSPIGLFVDPQGIIYFADSVNHRIRRLRPLVATTFARQSGDGQSAVTGARLANSLVVKVTGLGGLGVPGVSVAFAVTAGTATLSASSRVTGADGTASVDVTLGSAAGAVTISATVTGLPPVEFTVTATAPGGGGGGGTGPQISAGGIVGAGLSVPSVRQISSNGIFTIFGQNFAPAGTVKVVGGGDLVNGQVPDKLAGVCVQVGSAMGRIVTVLPTQVSVQAPTGLAAGPVNVQVLVNCRESNEVKSNIEPVTVAAATPEFFFFKGNADGRNPIAAANAVTGAFVGDASVIPGLTTPAKPGDFVTLYGTGFGATNPAVQAGVLPTALGRVTGVATVRLNGTVLQAVDVLYVGVTPQIAGLYQVNIHIPDNTPDGDLAVVVQIGAAGTPAGGFITVRK